MAASTLPPELVAPGALAARWFLDAKQVGVRLCCSWRHVLRMADQGVMPWGVKLGALRRWDVDELEVWIKDGCKSLSG